MTEDPAEALNILIGELRSREVGKWAEEIETVVGRGATEDRNVDLFGKKKAKHQVQRPLDSDEAYTVAIEMFVTLFEPILIKNKILESFAAANCGTTDVMWLEDYVEGSLISPQRERLAFPDITDEESEQLTFALSQLIDLLGER